MVNPARSTPELPEHGVVHRAFPPNLPIILNAKDLAHAPHLNSLHAPLLSEQSLRFVDAPASVLGNPNQPVKRNKEGAVLRGIKDLQQLQKQTIAVLESVKGTLDDIQQVLRSPEATRGMEKQQNAAALLTKGFAREAVEQAQGALALLPANPEAHLLLSLSLAADQQFDASLAVARKGLALVDRRQHPMAIECGLLHALAALGCGTEAVDRWATIIDALPLPVLFEQMARIAACFPTEPLGGGDPLLDELLNRRLARHEQNASAEDPSERRERIRGGEGIIEARPDEIPAPALLSALDASHDHELSCTHRAILAQIARRLQLVKDSGDVVKFLTECVVPLANRGLDRSAGALARASVKRLLRHHADAMTLHRALCKLELADTKVAMQEVASLLNHWRRAGNRVARMRQCVGASGLLLMGGVAAFAYSLFILHGRFLWLGPLLMIAGGLMGLHVLFSRTWHVALPEGRQPLTAEERAYLNTPSVRQTLRSALSTRPTQR